MRKIFWVLIFTIILPISLHAELFELYFFILDGDVPVIARVDFYRYNDNTYQISHIAGGNSFNFIGDANANGACDLGDENGSTNELTKAIKIFGPLGFYSGEFVVVVSYNNESYYIRFNMGNQWDLKVHYDVNTNDFYLSGNRTHTAHGQGEYTGSSYAFTLQNDFGGGEVEILTDGYKVDSENSPANWSLGSHCWPVSARTDDQDWQGLSRVFENWADENDEEITSSTGFTLPKVNNVTYTAVFHTEFHVTTQNDLPGYENGGTISVNGSSRTSPYNFDVDEDDDFTASGITQSIDNVQFTFNQWYKNGSPIQEAPSYTPTGNDTYTAKYDAKPLNWSRAIRCTTSIGQPVTIFWSDHPNDSVTSYQIWRKAGSGGTPDNKGSVNRGVETWTDPDYTRTGSTSDPLLQYDVRPFYLPTTTYGDSNFVNVVYAFIEQNVQFADHSYPTATAKEAVDDYSIGSYPNPFNPQTTINYKIPAAGYVSLKVYNSIGKEVVELVNANQEAGNHSVIFDGTNLASGIYLYSIQVNDFVQSGKMLLVK